MDALVGFEPTYMRFRRPLPQWFRLGNGCLFRSATERLKMADREGVELSRPFQDAGLANLCGYRFATYP